MIYLVCYTCISRHFMSPAFKRQCPKCLEPITSKPDLQLVKDLTFQSLADWIFPEFVIKENELRAQLIESFKKRREESQAQISQQQLLSMSPQIQISSSSNCSSSDSMMSVIKIESSSNSQNSNSITSQSLPSVCFPPQPEINFEFYLMPFKDDDHHLILDELPKKLKFANKNKTILTIKKHIHNYLNEPIENIEILCKNFPVADSHSLEYIKKTKWKNSNKKMELQYKRKNRVQVDKKKLQNDIFF
ncbi:UNKNOWN [Stylonychia lemnae]|uniref:Uncharacterized protein n=1 Tax=Stylonychia lemnae TaxID=5949 RepID=A0A078AFM4_STYLE|nr:UNKNOWN [Stylonychia lemnae]|eukprot:CDW81025.1 UNKNOWN [Stylonychia lemnae]